MKAARQAVGGGVSASKRAARKGKGLFGKLRRSVAAREEKLSRKGMSLKQVLARVDERTKKKASQWGALSPVLFWPYKTVILLFELLYTFSAIYMFFTLLQSVYFLPVVFIGFGVAWAPFQAAQETFITYLDIFASCIDGMINSFIRPIVNVALLCVKPLIGLYNWVVTFLFFNMKLFTDFFRGFIVQDLGNVLETQFGVPADIVDNILDFLDVTEPPGFSCTFSDPDYFQCVLDAVELVPIDPDEIFECRGFKVYKEAVQRFYGVPQKALSRAKNKTGTLDVNTVMQEYDDLIKAEQNVLVEKHRLAVKLANKRGDEKIDRWGHLEKGLYYNSRSVERGIGGDEYAEYNPDKHYESWKRSAVRKEAGERLKEVLESNDPKVRFLASSFPILANGEEYLIDLLEALCELMTSYFADWLEVLLSILAFIYDLAVAVTEYIINFGISSLVDLFVIILNFLLNYIDIPCLNFDSEGEFAASLVNCPCEFFTDALMLPYVPIDFTDPDTFLPAIFSCAGFSCALDFGNDPATFSFDLFITDCIIEPIDDVFCDQNSDCSSGFHCEKFVIPIVTDLSINFGAPSFSFKTLGWCQSNAKRSVAVDVYIKAMHSQRYKDALLSKQRKQISSKEQVFSEKKVPVRKAGQTSAGRMSEEEKYLNTYFVGDLEYWETAFDRQNNFSTMRALIESEWNKTLAAKVTMFVAKYRNVNKRKKDILAKEAQAARRQKESVQSNAYYSSYDEKNKVLGNSFAALKTTHLDDPDLDKTFLGQYVKAHKEVVSTIVTRPVRAAVDFYSYLGSRIFESLDERASQVGAAAFQVTWNNYDPRGRVVQVKGKPVLSDASYISNGEEWEDTSMEPSNAIDNTSNILVDNSDTPIYDSETQQNQQQQQQPEHQYESLENATNSPNANDQQAAMDHIEDQMSQGLTRMQVILRAFSDIVVDNGYIVNSVYWDQTNLEPVFPSYTDMKNMFGKMKTQEKYEHAYHHIIKGAKEYNEDNGLYTAYPRFVAQLEVVMDFIAARVLAPHMMPEYEKRLTAKSVQHALAVKEVMPLFRESYDPSMLSFIDDKAKDNYTRDAAVWDYHRYLRARKARKTRLYYTNPRAFAQHQLNMHSERKRMFRTMQDVMEMQERDMLLDNGNFAGRHVRYSSSSYRSSDVDPDSSVHEELTRIPALAPLFAMGGLASTAAKPAADLTTGAFIFLIKNPQVLGTVVPMFWSTEPGRVLTVQIARAMAKPLGSMYTVGLEKTFTPAAQLEFVEDFGLALFDSFMFGITYTMRLVACGWWSYILATVRIASGLIYVLIPGLGTVIGLVVGALLTFLTPAATVMPYCPPPPEVINFEPQVQPWNFAFNLLDCNPDDVCKTSADCISNAPCRCSTKPQYQSLFWTIDANKQVEPCEDNMGMPTGTCLCWPTLPCDTQVGQSRFNRQFSRNCYEDFGYRKQFVSLSQVYSQKKTGWYYNIRKFMRNLNHYISSHLHNWYNGSLFLSRFIAQGREKYISESVSWFLVAIVFGFVALTMRAQRLLWVMTFALLFIYGWQIYHQMLYHHVVPKMTKTKNTAVVGWFIRFLLTWVQYPNHSASNILGNEVAGEMICAGFNSGSFFAVNGSFAAFLLLLYVIWTGGILSATLNYIAYIFLVPSSMVEYGEGRRDDREDGGEEGFSEEEGEEGGVFEEAAAGVGDIGTNIGGSSFVPLFSTDRDLFDAQAYDMGGRRVRTHED